MNRELTIKLPRVIANDVTLEQPEGFRIVRVISRGDDTIVILEAANTDLRVSDVERVLAEAGKRIYAIKEYRTRTGCGLKDAKDAIDAAVPPTPRPDEW